MSRIYEPADFNRMFNDLKTRVDRLDHSSLFTERTVIDEFVGGSEAANTGSTYTTLGALQPASITTPIGVTGRLWILFGCGFVPGANAGRASPEIVHPGGTIAAGTYPYVGASDVGLVSTGRSIVVSGLPQGQATVTLLFWSNGSVTFFDPSITVFPI